MNKIACHRDRATNPRQNFDFAKFNEIKPILEKIKL